MMPDKNDLTVEEVCERTKFDAETVQRALRSGDLRGYKVAGSRWRVRPADLADWCPPNAPPPRKGRRRRTTDQAAEDERAGQYLAARGY